MNYSQEPYYTIENLVSKNKTKSTSIYSVLIFISLSFLICTPYIMVDITSQSRGIIRSDKENVLVNNIVNGKITFFKMRNNQSVNQGDTLLMVTSENLESQKRMNDTIYKNTKLLLNDIENLLSKKNSDFSTSRGKEIYNSFVSQQRELQNRLDLAKLNFDRQAKLFKKNVISQSEYDKYKFELNNAKRIVLSFLMKNNSSWEQQKQELKERLINLENNNNNLETESANYVLTAPISGTLENVKGLQLGSFVNSSQIVAQISPNSKLIVENTVSPFDIGLLKLGQKVKFQVDAFNYNQWGTLEGKIIEIDKNITLEENAAFFRVRCDLKETRMRLNNNYSTEVSKGMTLTTRYFVTRRSIYDLLFDKIDNWLNPKLLDTKSFNNISI